MISNQKLLAMILAIAFFAPGANAGPGFFTFVDPTIPKAMLEASKSCL